ncbi:AAA family ATPase [Blastococcus sp. VKM Ac-2987]|uniref:AAA family ATPase n=1 Tax=Blastococcus sp. VKM Ac-2987 TaxID=3004141 RepID=UPI0022AB6505|nr:AAA family ATPase [Blastococcus sp. VKM Ac-2987]MCZ2859701.1 AAA family ATPase [Blastococcus sp. VKM Ac-2987]
MPAPTGGDLPLSRVRVRADVTDPGAWFWGLPGVAQLRAAGMELAPVTVVVGENGSGKSTLVEAVAHAWSASLTAAVKHWGPLPSAEDADLWRDLELAGERPRPQGGVWLRGEAMHDVFTGIDSAASELRAFDGVPLNARSHGEGFLALLESRTTERGLWVLDEPESALSFRSSLRLMALLHGVAATGSQVLLATHSPVLAALPGARVYELDGAGFTARPWAELDLVQDWQSFFDAPERLLRHLLDG